MKVGVLVNANAGRHAGRDRLSARYREAGALVLPTRSLDELPAAVAELAAAGVDRVALSGGDGSIHRGLTALARHWPGELPPLAFLPAGTMNTVCRGLGVRGGPLQVLRAAQAPSPTLRERSPIDAGDHRLGFLVGTGFWARFLAAYDELSGPGPVRAAAVLGRGLLSTAVRGRFVRELFAPVDAAVELNGERVGSGPFTMVAAGAVPQVGLGFAPFRGIDQHPDLFHALVFAASPPAVAVQLPRLYRGGAPRPPDRGERATRLVITANREPIVWAIDGDVQPAVHRLELGVGPRLKLVLG